MMKKMKVMPMKNTVILKTSKHTHVINKSVLPKKITVRRGFLERHQVRQEIYRASKNSKLPDGLYVLAELVEKDIQRLASDSIGNFWAEWYRLFAYETIYEIAFSRGVRQERQRRKHRNNIGALTENDRAELAHALNIDISKLNTAVLELTTDRKAV
ncbi:hypothetical protein GHK52_02200 [Lactococcus garvieae]|nr:hypothetical protein [Lactococcus garvieae]